MIDFGVVRPQGFGKSHIIVELCKELPGNKLIIEPTEGINEYLKRFGIQKNTSCIIYLDLLNKDFNPKVLLKYDYIFLDEMHRALAPKWGKVLKEVLTDYKGKIVGFSATPIRGDNRNPIDELFSGEQISRLDLIDAIINNLLPQPTYVTGIYEITEEDKNKIIKNKKLARQIYKYDLQNNLEFIFKKYLDLTSNKCIHIIVFVHTIKFIEKAKELMNRWINTTSINTYEVHCKQSQYDNFLQLREFEGSDSGINIIFSSNMLSEGIHPKNLDAVVFLRNTRSNIVFNQQLGRIISEYLDNPIVFDLVNNIYNVENGYISRLKEYSKNNGIRFEQLKTKLGEPLKIYEEQKDLVNLLRNYLAIRITKEQKEFILNNYKNMSVIEMAKKLNIEDWRVRDYLKRNKIKYSKDKRGIVLTEKEKQYILDNCKYKLISEIAKELNRSSSPIKKYLIDNNIEYKSRKLTEKQKEYLLSNKEVLTLEELSNVTKISKKTIKNFFINNNISYKKHRDLTEAEKEYILNNYMKKPLNDIAKEIDKGIYTVKKFCKNNTLLQKTYKFSKARLSLENLEYINKYRLIKNSKEIAEYLGVSRQSIDNYYKNNKLSHLVGYIKEYNN